MSGWEEFKNDAGKIVSKAAVRAGEITDAATAKIKLQGIKLRLCEKYEQLGRLIYKTRRDGIDVTAQIDEVTAQIDDLRADMKKAQRDINARRESAARRARQAAEEREAYASEAGYTEDTAEGDSTADIGDIAAEQV